MPKDETDQILDENDAAREAAGAGPLESFSDAELSAELLRRARTCPRWGIFIPEQWVKGVACSSKSVAEGVARSNIRGPFSYEIRVLPGAPVPVVVDLGDHAEHGEYLVSGTVAGVSPLALLTFRSLKGEEQVGIDLDKRILLGKPPIVLVTQEIEDIAAKMNVARLRKIGERDG
jgi:hypothetical protein